MTIKRGVIHTLELYFQFPARELDQRISLNEFEEHKSRFGNATYHHSPKGDYDLGTGVPFKSTMVIYQGCIFKEPAYAVYTKVDLYKLIGDEVNEEYLDLVLHRIDDYLYSTYRSSIKDQRLVTLDYSWDIEMSAQEMALFLKLYQESTMPYIKRFRKKTVANESDKSNPTFYFNSCASKSSKNRVGRSKVLRVYNKYLECREDKYRDILRMEVSLKNHYLNYQAYQHDIQKEIPSYLHRILGFECFKKEYSKIFFSSDFHRFDKAIEEIRNSNSSMIQKSKLIWFLEMVTQHGLAEVCSKPKPYKLSKEMISKRVKDLERLNINPLCLPLDSSLEKIINPINRVREYISN
jgi:hypothetical protein